MEFYTIGSATESLYKEKGSKFLSFAYPVVSEADIKTIQEELRKQFHDARHHCFAWILGMEVQTYRANDDGEPNHSAGDPILGQIRSFDLTNTLVVVVRYFGGTKLGVGGLINAYKTAAEQTLTLASKIQIFETKKLLITFDYGQMSIVERLIGDYQIDVSARDFLENCQISGTIKNDFVEDFKHRISDLYELNVSFIDDEQIS